MSERLISLTAVAQALRFELDLRPCEVGRLLGMNSSRVSCLTVKESWHGVPWEFRARNKEALRIARLVVKGQDPRKCLDCGLDAPQGFYCKDHRYLRGRAEFNRKRREARKLESLRKGLYEHADGIVSAEIQIQPSGPVHTHQLIYGVMYPRKAPKDHPWRKGFP